MDLQKRFEERFLLVGKWLLKMVAETEIVCLQQSVPVLDVNVNNYFRKGNKIEEIQDIVAVTPPVSPKSFQVRVSEPVSTDLCSSQVVGFPF